MVDFISRTGYESLPVEVAARVKLAIRDNVGVMLAARGDRSVAAAAKTAIALGGAAEATLIDAGVKVPSNLAAMVNAVMTGTLDMDDGAYRPVGHLAHAGRLVVPTCLAVAESRHASGKDFIAAAAIAYEVTFRAGWLVRLWDVMPSGCMVGTYGAAAGTAKLLGLSPGATAEALGVADAFAVQPSRAQFLKGKTMTKDSVAWGAMTGVTAALLAGTGFEGPATIFDLEEYHREPLQTLGTEWETMRLYFKPYASCRYTHAPLDGLLQLMRQNGLVAGDIRKVIIGFPSAAVRALGNYRPANTWEAQFSMPYVAGAALADGVVGPAQIAESRLGDTRLLAEVDKVSLVGDAEADALRPGMVPGRVRITGVDGREFETWVPYPRGAPENPLSDAEIKQKFLGLAGDAIGDGAAADLGVCLDRLEELADVGELVAKLRSL